MNSIYYFTLHMYSLLLNIKILNIQIRLILCCHQSIRSLHVCQLVYLYYTSVVKIDASTKHINKKRLYKYSIFKFEIA